MAQTGKKAGRELRPTLRAGRHERAGEEDGFTLLEAVCVVAIIAILAAVLLPKIPRATSRPRLEAYAIETASLLKTDRSAAIRRQVQVATDVNAMSRLVRSGASGRVVQIPDDVAFDAILPERCNQRAAFATISFFASGMSCGGAIALTRFGVGFEIRVNWLTGGIEVVPRNTF
jgi:general secretion pathway protein H